MITNATSLNQHRLDFAGDLMVQISGRNAEYA